MDAQALTSTVETFWETDAIPALVDYLRIPNKSPAFDPDWAAHGYMEQATRLYAMTAERLLAGVAGAKVEVFRLEGRTPVILIDVPATAAAADPQAPVLFYGHLDKQPEATGWSPGLGPWAPVRRDGRLYGRGAADDGYAMFGASGRDPGRGRAGYAARPLPDPDRGLRGERQLRPARLHRPSGRPAGGRRRWWCVWTQAAATTSSSG